MNVEQAIRNAVDNGKVVLGERETLKYIRDNNIKLVILAANCPTPLKESVMNLSTKIKLPVYEFNGTTLALGSICRRPFHVSMMGVIEAGSSEVLELGKK